MAEKSYILGEEVLEWVETIALLKRLGVDITKPSRHLVVEINIDRVVVVTHEYLGVDANEI